MHYRNTCFHPLPLINSSVGKFNLNLVDILINFFYYLITVYNLIIIYTSIFWNATMFSLKKTTLSLTKLF